MRGRKLAIVRSYDVMRRMRRFWLRDEIDIKCYLRGETEVKPKTLVSHLQNSDHTDVHLRQ